MKTIYEALRDKLDREPTHAELKADVLRALQEAAAEIAEMREAARPAPRQIDLGPGPIDTRGD